MQKVTTVRLPEELRKRLEIQASLQHRSLSQQIKEDLNLALAAEQNPDLPLQFIKDILKAKAERKMGLAAAFEL
ncbi:MAG: hypothetical protein J7M11_00240 [Elusimicrobia bacterium]|nr:hypothetical protein [Elusimicrobiota bacterium]